MPHSFYKTKNLKFFFNFLSFQGCTHGIWKFPGQGSNWSCSCPAYTTATAMLDLSCVCDLYHSSQQHWILKRDQTRNLMVPSRIRSPFTTESRWELPKFSFRCFMVTGLMPEFLIHYQLIFMHDIRQWSSFILLHVALWFSQHQFLRRLSFPHCVHEFQIVFHFH